MITQNPFIQTKEKYSQTLFSLGKYELECYVFESKPNKPSLYVRDVQTNVYNHVSDFYRFCWDAKEIKNDLIPTIDEVVERGWGDEILSSELLTAIIEPDSTYFTKNHNLALGKKEAIENDYMQLKTVDFKRISTKWLEFLESNAK